MDSLSYEVNERWDVRNYEVLKRLLALERALNDQVNQSLHCDWNRAEFRFVVVVGVAEPRAEHLALSSGQKV